MVYEAHTRLSRGRRCVYLIGAPNTILVAKRATAWERKNFERLNDLGIPRYEGRSRIQFGKRTYNTNYDIIEYVGEPWSFASPSSLDHARETLLQLLDILGPMHDRGWSHGDIKSSNIMHFNGLAKLIDYEMSYHKSHCLYGRFGTKGKYSPESAGGFFCPQTEVYQLGAYILQMIKPNVALQCSVPLDCKQPDALSYRALKRMGFVIPHQAAGVGHNKLSKLLMIMLQKDPANRCSMSDVAYDAARL